VGRGRSGRVVILVTVEVYMMWMLMPSPLLLASFQTRCFSELLVRWMDMFGHSGHKKVIRNGQKRSTQTSVRIRISEESLTNEGT
jgi:hypothetical protein